MSAPNVIVHIIIAFAENMSSRMTARGIAKFVINAEIGGNGIVIDVINVLMDRVWAVNGVFPRVKILILELLRKKKATYIY